MDVDALEKPTSLPPSTGYTRLRDLIRADIVEGELPQGSRLKIAELAARYKASAIPVREALQQLQGEGIVTFTPHCGARVRNIDEAFIRNIHEVREFSEPYLLRWFVRHHTQAELAKLERVQEAYDAAVERGDLHATRALNRRFHAICYDRHYNAEALTVARRHSDLIWAISVRFPPSRARSLAVGREHWAIIKAIRAANEDEAAAVIAAHVRHAGVHLVEVLRQAEHVDGPHTKNSASSASR